MKRNKEKNYTKEKFIEALNLYKNNLILYNQNNIGNINNYKCIHCDKILAENYYDLNEKHFFCEDCLNKIDLGTLINDLINKILNLQINEEKTRINILDPIYNVANNTRNYNHKCLECNNDKEIITKLFCYKCFQSLSREDFYKKTLNYIIDEYHEYQYQKKQQKLNNCIFCKKETSNKIICDDCLKKYQNKDIFLKINSQEQNIIILDEKYQGNYVCNDGHIVKSMGEKIIDDYLFENKILHIYEPKISIDIDKEITPDFQIPNYKNSSDDIYIEHFGISNNKSYESKTNYKLNIYSKENITLICTYEEDLKDIKKALDKKLKFYKPKQINFNK